MMRKFVLAFLLVLGANCFTQGQTAKSVDEVNQLWFGYFNQSRLRNKWGTWTDVQLRTKENFVNNFSTGFVRLGLTYYASDDTKLTAGYAYVNNFPSEGFQHVSQPEHRPWQQVQWHTKHGKKRAMQWFRLDERFRRKIANDSTLADGYNFNFRIRYNFWYDVPLSRKGIVPGTFSFVVNDEVHVNFGKQIVNNTFDQNRFFVGFKYQLNPTNNIQFGYMNVFQQLPAGNRYRSIHAARLFYFQNLDFR